MYTVGALKMHFPKDNINKNHRVFLFELGCVVRKRAERKSTIGHFGKHIFVLQDYGGIFQKNRSETKSQKKV